MSTTNPTHITTEWEDLQVKHGNYEEREKPITNEELTAAAVEFAEKFDPLERKTIEELNDLEDEVDEEVLRQYRQARIAELKAQAAKPNFGDLFHLGKNEYQSEVTDGSKTAPVVLHLYKESRDDCVLLNRILTGLSRKFRHVKFLKAISTDVIANYPDSRLPAVLVYIDGQCHAQLLGKETWGKTLTMDNVEWVLASNGAFKTDLENDPRLSSSSILKHRIRAKQEEEAEEDSDVEADRGYASLRMGHKKYRDYRAD